MGFWDNVLLSVTAQFRNVINPIVSRIMDIMFYNKLPSEVDWNNIKNLPIQDFSNFINKYPYKKNREILGFKVDYTISDPSQFFQKRDYDRNCVDFAKLWEFWGRENGFKAMLLEVYDKADINTMHATCVLEKNGIFTLCDFNTIFETKVFKELLNKISQKYKFKGEIVYTFIM